MVQALFYHLTETSLADALPMLVEKCRARDWRVAIETKDEARRDALDDHLWSYRRDSFLVHGRDGDHPDTVPVYLTMQKDNPNAATVRFQLDGTLPPENVEIYERLMILFDGTDSDAVNTARAQWKSLKKAGHTLTYYKQSSDGRWEKAQ